MLFFLPQNCCFPLGQKINFLLFSGGSGFFFSPGNNTPLEFFFFFNFETHKNWKKIKKRAPRGVFFLKQRFLFKVFSKWRKIIFINKSKKKMGRYGWIPTKYLTLFFKFGPGGGFFLGLPPLKLPCFCFNPFLFSKKNFKNLGPP